MTCRAAIKRIHVGVYASPHFTCRVRNIPRFTELDRTENNSTVTVKYFNTHFILGIHLRGAWGRPWRRNWESVGSGQHDLHAKAKYGRESIESNWNRTRLRTAARGLRGGGGGGKGTTLVGRRTLRTRHVPPRLSYSMLVCAGGEGGGSSAGWILRGGAAAPARPTPAAPPGRQHRLWPGLPLLVEAVLPLEATLPC